MVGGASGDPCSSACAFTNRSRAPAFSRGGVVKFALVNPAWSFAGSIYFGCPEPHYPLELMFGAAKLRESGHEALAIDAHQDGLSLQDVRHRIDSFAPDFLVIPTAPSYLFWRCPPPELRVPKSWFAALGSH